MRGRDVLVLAGICMIGAAKASELARTARMSYLDRDFKEQPVNVLCL